MGKEPKKTVTGQGLMLEGGKGDWPDVGAYQLRKTELLLEVLKAVEWQSLFQTELEFCQTFDIKFRS